MKAAIYIKINKNSVESLELCKHLRLMHNKIDF